MANTYTYKINNLIRDPLAAYKLRKATPPVTSRLPWATV